MAYYFTTSKLQLLKLLDFKNKILKEICSTIFDIELNIWRRKKTTELIEITKVPLLTSYIKY